MQPFPMFDVIRVVEQDLAEWHEDRARRRAAEGYPVENPADQTSRFMRLIALFTPSRQPKTSSACGD